MLPLINLPTFQYDGIPWTPAVIAGRLGVIVVAALIALLASWFFHRFDPAKAETGLSNIFKGRVKQNPASLVEMRDMEKSLIAPTKNIALTPLPSRAHPGAWQGYRQLIKSEFRLTFKSTRWLWYLIALGIIAVAWVLPADSARLVMLPMAWVWPLTLWSGLGTREARFHTEQVVFSAPFSLGRQLPVTWLVGVLISLAMGSGIIPRDLLAGQWASLLAMLIGALFIPSLALTLGIWSGASKLFEGSYLFVWYLASVVSVQPLDFMGRLSGSFQSGIHWTYGALTLLLIGMAVIGRSRQIKQ